MKQIKIQIFPTEQQKIKIKNDFEVATYAYTHFFNYYKINLDEIKKPTITANKYATIVKNSILLSPEHQHLKSRHRGVLRDAVKDAYNDYENIIDMIRRKEYDGDYSSPEPPYNKNKSYSLALKVLNNSTTQLFTHEMGIVDILGDQVKNKELALSSLERHARLSIEDDKYYLTFIDIEGISFTLPEVDGDVISIYMSFDIRNLCELKIITSNDDTYTIELDNIINKDVIFRLRKQSNSLYKMISEMKNGVLESALQNNIKYISLTNKYDMINKNMESIINKYITEVGHELLRVKPINIFIEKTPKLNDISKLYPNMHTNTIYHIIKTWYNLSTHIDKLCNLNNIIYHIT